MKQKLSKVQIEMPSKKEAIQKEQGRSMVEMLGVLAIIGVLSIGGIAGYTMAMNRYKANQILDIASKLSISIQNACAANPNLTRFSIQNSVFPSFNEIDIEGSSSRYEVTFIMNVDVDKGAACADVQEGKDIVVYSPQPNNGVRSALESVTGKKATVYTNSWEFSFEN